jgi:hypothetical protein
MTAALTEASTSANPDDKSGFETRETLGRSTLIGSALRRLLASIDRETGWCIKDAGEAGIGDEELPPPEQPANNARIADPLVA